MAKVGNLGTMAEVGRQGDVEFKSIVDSVPGMVWLSGVDGACVYVGERWLDFTGRGWDEELGDGWIQGVHSEDRQRCSDARAAAVAGQELYTVEYRCLNGHGEYRWIVDTGVPWYAADGDFAGYVGSRVDVTERKQAENLLAVAERELELRAHPGAEQVARTGAALEFEIAERRRTEETLRESEWLFRQLADNIREVFWIAEPGNRVLYVSPAYEEIWGRTRERLYADPKSWIEAIHPDDRERAAGAVERQIEGEFTAEEYRIVRPDGSLRWIWDRGFPLAESAGTPRLFTGIAEDVTRRKDRELTLTLTQFSVDRAIDAIYWVDRQGRLSYVNEAACASLAYTREELSGLSVFDFVPELSESAFRDLWQQVERDRHVTVESRHRRKDGTEFPVEVAINYLESDAWQGCCAFARDLTTRKRAEATQRALQEKTQQTRKMESLGVLAGGIAHDFNNILMTILGHAELALMDLPGESPAVEDVKEISAASRRAAELTKQMLAYAGKGVLVPRPLDLSTQVTEMERLLEALVSADVDVSYELADGLPAIEADPSQIRQVVTNLVANASEAIGETRGVITIRTAVLEEKLDGPEGDSGGETFPRGSVVCLEIADTGPGMDEATKERIFDPFFTTKFAGRGLGLGAVLGIVRGHGGALEVESAPGRGTRIVASFPALSETAAVAEHTAAEAESWRGAGTVLVVDDESPIRMITGRILERHGLTVLTASDGEEALRVFARHAESIALVVLDLTMPRMDGEATFRELRRARPDVKVLLASGYSERDVAARFTGDDRPAFIQKPYSPDELIDKVRRILDTG